MSELKREELLDELEQAFSCKLADAWQYPSRKPKIEQALEQIRAFIEQHGRSELIKEKLLGILETAFSHLLKNINYKETRAKYEQAREQIKALIQSHPNLKQSVAQGQGNLKNKSLMKLAQDLGVSFSAAKIISDHALVEEIPLQEVSKDDRKIQ